MKEIKHILFEPMISESFSLQLSVLIDFFDSYIQDRTLVSCLEGMELRFKRDLVKLLLGSLVELLHLLIQLSILED